MVNLCMKIGQVSFQTSQYSGAYSGLYRFTTIHEGEMVLLPEVQMNTIVFEYFVNQCFIVAFL